MGDRSHAHITIGGAVRRKHWRDVADALESEFGSKFERYVLRGDAKELKQCTAPQLLLAHARLEEELRTSHHRVPFASAGIPLKKLDRLVGVALEFDDDSVSGGRFDDLQALLRDIGLCYLVHSDGFAGSWPIADTWWLLDDPHRDAEGWGPFYNTYGERYVEYIDGERNVRVAMDEEQILAAFKIARNELSKVELPPGPDLGEEILRRAIEVGMKLPIIPPLSILE